MSLTLKRDRAGRRSLTKHPTIATAWLLSTPNKVAAEGQVLCIVYIFVFSLFLLTSHLGLHYSSRLATPQQNLQQPGSSSLGAAEPT